VRALLRYGCANAEATRSAPGKGWKLNRSKPACLLRHQSSCRRTVAFWRKCDAFLGQLATPAAPAPRARVTKQRMSKPRLEKETAAVDVPFRLNSDKQHEAGPPPLACLPLSRLGGFAEVGPQSVASLEDAGRVQLLLASAPDPHLDDVE